MSESIIMTNQLTKVYKLGREKTIVLNNVSIEVNKGEFLVIRGSSGSGKSTLLHLLGGLDRPTSGEVIVNGTDITKISDRKLSKFRSSTLGFVFQFFYLQPFLTLEKNIELPSMFSRMKRKSRKNRVQELSKLVGLSDILNHYPSELSGGQIQRAAIIRILLNNPKIILADEPTGNLDSENSRIVIELLLKIRKDFGTTVVIATHDPQIAEVADRVLSIKDGQIYD